MNGCGENKAMTQSSIMETPPAVPASGLQAAPADAGPTTCDVIHIQQELNTS
jgi:hypothetical protein